MSAPVCVQGLEKSYGSTQVLRQIDLSVGEGEFVSLLGPSGCGKSTLLRVIAGLEHAEHGDILMKGHKVNALSPRERNVAMVFQNYALYPHMTVAQNIALPLCMKRFSPLTRQPWVHRWWPGCQQALRQIDQSVRDIAESLSLAHLLERKPGQLSGGQRQRVALARAMVRNPAIFLMDEPLSNLDAKLRIEVRDELADLHQRLGAAFLYVTHDQTEALTLSHRVAVMSEGRILQIDKPERLYSHPTNLAVARFIGSPGINTWAIPGTFGHTLGLRPEHVQVKALHSPLTDSGFVAREARLLRIENHGADCVLQAEAPDGTRIQAKMSLRTLPEGLRPGEQVQLQWHPCDGLVFDGQGHRVQAA